MRCIKDFTEEQAVFFCEVQVDDDEMTLEERSGIAFNWFSDIN